MRDRKFLCFLGSAVLAVLLAFVLVPDLAAIVFVARAGFWIMLATFALFARALWSTYREELLRWRWQHIDRVTLGIIAVCGVILLVHETFGFKIVMDEIMLLGTSMAMHLDKTVLTPVRGNDIQGSFTILDGMMDKRPLFFPFLLSLLHDLTGYRPANAFILNGILTFILLGLVYTIGRRLAGRPAGWLGVVLLAGLPLLAQNATGGGFELLNLVMIAATLVLAERWIDRRDGPALTAFCFSALLLAQVRYESVIYLLPVALVVLWIWFEEKRFILTWPVVLAPLLMVHYPLQHRIFALRGSSWQMESKPGYDVPFSVKYIADNLSHAYYFFSVKASDQPNSLVLSILGWLAIPFFALLMLKILRQPSRSTPMLAATAFFSIGFALQFLLMMCYFWGNFEDPIIRRLSLPTHLFLVVGVLAVLTQFTRPVVVRTLLGLATLGLLARSIPSMAAHAYSQEYLPGRETAWRRQFIADQPRRDYLMIDNDSILWIAHEVSATPVFQAKQHRDSLVYHLRNHTFSGVYVFQRLNVDPDTGKMTLRDGDDLGPDYILEPVREERLQLLTLDRISRVVEIRDGAASLTAPTPEPVLTEADRTRLEAVRHAYLENFMKQLP